MATFSESQISGIATVLKSNSRDVKAIVDFYASQITESDKTKVEDLLSRWETANLKFTSILPTESNRGVKIEAEKEKNEIRQQIANLTFTTSLINASNGQFRLVRG